MEPNNIEKQIKEKLNSREIQPSEMAWDRLDAMLSVTEEKKTKRSFGWLYIAASILVLITAGTFYFNQKNTEINTNNQVVIAKDITNDTLNSTPKSIQEKIIQNPIIIQEKQPLVQVEPINKNNHQKSKSSFNSINQKTTNNPIINKDKEIEYQSSEVIAQKELPRVSTKKEISVSKQSNENVDDLIAAAQTTNSDKKATIKVNANSLLSQVDGELDQSFRQKVINKISKNYQEVKVALINRNQE